MRTVMIASALLAGCSFHAASKPGDAGMNGSNGGSDAGRGMDAPDPPPDAPPCFGSGQFQVCLTAAPAGPQMLSGNIDTSAGSQMCANPAPTWKSSTQPDACFIVGTTISLTDAVTVTGGRPLVLLATDTATIGQLVDVSAHADVSGPGAPSTDCPAFTTAPQTDGNATGGGGAGATFQTAGGDGGTGDGAGAAGRGLHLDPGAAPTTLRGGCAGQAGASGVAATGAAGGAGGALAIIAGTKIALSANINASGGGAQAPGKQAGGSGGGAGGMIVLDAPMITVGGTSVAVLANGGGGASGGAGGPGMPGADATFAYAAAAGGTGGGGAGGAGDFYDGLATTPDFAGAGTGNNGTGSKGGGGGGGGVGYIFAPSGSLTGAHVSPPPQPIP